MIASLAYDDVELYGWPKYQSVGDSSTPSGVAYQETGRCNAGPIGSDGYAGKPPQTLVPVKIRTVRRQALPGRNDRCPCGSGKKYKRCCIKARRVST